MTVFSPTRDHETSEADKQAIAQRLDDMCKEISIIKTHLLGSQLRDAEIENLKQEIIMHKQTINNLQSERNSLIETIEIIMSNKNSNSNSIPSRSCNPVPNNNLNTSPPSGRNINASKRTDTSTTNNSRNSSTKQKEKKNTRNSKKQPEISKAERIPTNEQVGAQSNHRQTTTIVGDSIISKLNGWKMSNKNNRVYVKAFPGATVDDMNDYVKPIVRKQPDNIIVHVGTNNLRDDEPNAVADKIVGLCEYIESNHPSCKIAISELTVRRDDLEHARRQVNKALSSFCRSRDWAFIRHNDITDQQLNEKGLHLNHAGVSVLAKNFNNHIKSNH